MLRPGFGQPQSPVSLLTPEHGAVPLLCVLIRVFSPPEQAPQASQLAQEPSTAMINQVVSISFGIFSYQ